MPEQSESQQATITVTPEQTPQPQSPQQETREALYNKLYNSQPQQQEQAVEPHKAPQDADYKALYGQLASQVQELLAKQAAPQVAVAAQPRQVQEDWFALLQQGKRTEAEQVLKDYVAQGAQQKIIQETLVQAMELNRMEREIEDFNNSVRANNSDMLDVEDLVSLRAEKEFERMKPTIKNNKEYVEAYKKAVTTSVDAIRTVLRRTRAAAKNEAMTTRRDVLASTTMPPNDIQRREETNGQHQPPAEIEMQSPTDYLAARQAKYRQNAGM